MIPLKIGGTVLHSTPEKVTSNHALLFLHGYYGSSLHEAKTEKLYFLNTKNLLLGRAPIYLRPKTLGVEDAPEFFSGGILGEVALTPGLSTPVYSPMIRFLEKQENTQTIPFAFDWREDLFVAVKKLADLIHSLQGKGVKKISVFAHSMGGLVLAYYLRYGTQDPTVAKENWVGRQQIQKSIFLGTPFRGTTAIFRNLVRGVQFYGNKKMLARDVVASFPSSYALLPHEYPELLKLPLWEKNKIGLFSQTSMSAKTLEARRAFTKEVLACSKNFQEKILAPAQTEDPGHNLNIFGVGRLSQNSYYYAAEKHSFYFRPQKLAPGQKTPVPLLSDGDETVTIASAQLPSAFLSQSKTLATPFGHGDLFMDPAVQKEMQQFLVAR